jgi:hypothetical protein
MVPPPEWNTQQYGWPLANRKVTTHTIGRKDVKITEHFSWKNSVINLCIYSFIGGAALFPRALYLRIKKNKR